MASNFGSFESSTIITSFVTANWFWFGVTLNQFSRKLIAERLDFIARRPLSAREYVVSVKDDPGVKSLKIPCMAKLDQKNDFGLGLFMGLISSHKESPNLKRDIATTDHPLLKSYSPGSAEVDETWNSKFSSETKHKHNWGASSQWSSSPCGVRTKWLPGKCTHFKIGNWVFM